MCVKVSGGTPETTAAQYVAPLLRTTLTNIITDNSVSRININVQNSVDHENPDADKKITGPLPLNAKALLLCKRRVMLGR